LASKRLSTLLPAVELIERQETLRVNVRSSSDLHDRYLFVDRSQCYLSGASFKDGAKNAPAALTPSVDS
jgi:hypothetical protein